MLSKGTQTTVHEEAEAAVEAAAAAPPPLPSTPKELTPTSKSLWRMFSDDWLPTTIMPENILGVPVVDIQSDLREGTTQISEL